jgi:predicted CopG family antitoxin
MAKITTISFADDEYERLAKLAKIEGKSFSRFVKDKLKDAIDQDIKQTSLLERLIKNLENLQNFTGTREIYKLLVFLCEHEKTVAEYTILADHKRKEYILKRQEMEQRLGIRF